MMSTFSSTDDKNTERNETLNATNALTGWGQFWTILRMSFWRNKNIAIVATIMMLVSLPLMVVIVSSTRSLNVMQQHDAQDLYKVFFTLVFFCTCPISTIIMILGASQMFSFLHQRPALDVYHALPVRRRSLFFGRFAAGFLLTLIPQMIAVAVTCLVVLLPTFSLLNIGQIIQTALITFLLSLAFYAVCCLAFILTGSILDALFMLFLLNIAYPATIYTVETFVSMTLPGFTMSSGSNLGQLFLISPLGMLFAAVVTPMDLLHILWWVVLVVLMTIGSMLIYQRRKSELAGTAYAYRLPFYVLRFLASVVMGLVLGYLFELQYGSVLSYIMGALIGSLVTHVLIEAILSRGFSGLCKSLLSYALFVIVFVIGCLSVSTGFFGFDTRLPAKDRIIQIEVSSNELNIISQTAETTTPPRFSDRDNQAIILEINQAWLKEISTMVIKPYDLNTQHTLQFNSSAMWMQDFDITYKLDSGLEMVRTIYPDFSKEPYASLLNKLQNCKEYAFQKYARFFQPIDRPESLFMTTKTNQLLFSFGIQAYNERYNRIVAALKQDLLENAASKINSRIIGFLKISDIEYQIYPNGYYLDQLGAIRLTDAFSNTVAVLNEYDLLKDQENLSRQYTTAYIVSNIQNSDYFKSIKKDPSYQQRDIVFKYLPDGSSTPFLDNKDVFTKIEQYDMVIALNKAGRPYWSKNEPGYFLLLATTDQSNSELPVLFVPADQMPPEITALINK